MNMMKVLELVAEIQPHIDQGISTTLTSIVIQVLVS